MILLNGELQDSEKIHLDSGFYFGRGLFETMSVKRKPVFLTEHLNRINSGLQIIGVNKKITEEDVLEAVSKLNCEDCVLKLVVTDKNVIYTTRKNNYTEEQYKKGFSIKISTVKRNPYSKITYLKSLNYLENILEHENCIEEGYNEVVFFNTNEKLAEGSVSNVFFIKDKKIYTPSTDCGLLNGTVRKFIVNNYDIIEGEFDEEDLMNSDEIFLTNSIMGVMKVSKVCDKHIKGSVITENIRREYEEYLK
jgi:Branched-chain amino acid aminotransferase/4-amino-4-deoxychorismate lyase